MADRAIPAHTLSTLLEQVARALHAMGYASDLFPAQWSALRYFGRAEDTLRTASALARYQGLATGPVTRTVRTLIGKGLLAKGGSLGRGRSERVDVTEVGRTLLAGDPLTAVTAALDTLTEAEKQAVATALEVVLRRLQGDQGVHSAASRPGRPA